MPNKSNNSNRRKNNELHGKERLHIISNVMTTVSSALQRCPEDSEMSLEK